MENCIIYKTSSANSDIGKIMETFNSKMAGCPAYIDSRIWMNDYEDEELGQHMLTIGCESNCEYLKQFMDALLAAIDNSN